MQTRFQLAALNEGSLGAGSTCKSQLAQAGWEEAEEVKAELKTQ